MPLPWEKRTMLVEVDAYHDGQFWCGRGIRGDFFSQGRTLDELLNNITELALLHFEDQPELGESLSLLLRYETEIGRGKVAARRMR
jgi:predicted RNase H-like HicB family nuclease